MKKFVGLTVKLLLILLILGAVVSVYLLVREYYEASGITVTVLDSADTPIPSAIIRFVSEEQGVTIQHQTDSNGKIFFKKLTPGVYKISATQISCSETEAATISIHIQGRNMRFNYYPCH